MRPAILALAACLVLAVLGCVSTGEPLRAETPEPEFPPARKRITGAREEDGLEIVTRPEQARAYLDNRYVGLTPLFLDDLPQGRYKLTLRRSGYYTTSEWIDYSGGYVLYSASLQMITGFLSVEVAPASAEVRVGSEVLSPGRLHELPVGTHAVRARAFGYQEQTQNVQILERELTPLRLTLEPAPFSLSDLRASHGAFNPRNAGLLGRLRVRFRVSTPGSGTVRILDSDGREVYAAELPPFDSWEQSLQWDGRDPSGQPLPDGAYRLRLTAVSRQGALEAGGELELRIDRSLLLAYRSLWSGSAGSLYCPTPEMLPGGSLQLSSLVLGGGGEAGLDAPLDLSLRLGIGAERRYELDLLAGAIAGYSADAPLPFFAAAAFKTPLAGFGGDSLAGALAVQAKLAGQAAAADRLADFSGLSVGFPAALRFGPLTLAACPELTLSAWRPGTGASGFQAWTYGRRAALLDMPPFGVAVSGALRSRPFQEGWGLDPPVHAGLEGHWLIPGTQLFLSLAMAAELASGQAPQLYGGCGLGLLR